MRHVLIAVSGDTPQIITETVYALLTRKEPVLLSEVHVVTTLKGRKALQDHLLDPENGQFWKLWDEYGSGPPPRFSIEETVHVLRDANDKDLEDIRTSEENDQARRQIFDIVRKLTSDPEVCLHGSIAGGRKSMGFLLGAAMQFFGRQQDRLYHVLVNPREVEAPGVLFYYRPVVNQPIYRLNLNTGQRDVLEVDRDGNRRPLYTQEVEVELAEIPVCRVREIAQFVAPGDYREETLEATQKAIDAYAEKIRQEYISQVERRSDNAFPEIVGQSDKAHELKQRICAVAPYKMPILIEGETGSGKEMVVEAIHKASGVTGRIVSTNCATIRPELMLSTLFGHEKGAFTGASTQQKGLFEQADGGTLFLDEIHLLPSEAQGALLRVIEGNRIERVGGKGDIPVDVRLIVATNRKLEREVTEGRFPQDLFMRISTLDIKVPSLNERPEDISLLANHFLAEFNQTYKKKDIRGFTPGALNTLNNRRWPGNIRELKKVVHRAAVSAPVGGFISEATLHSEEIQGGRPVSLQQAVEQFEAEQIRQALARHSGHHGKAAAQLKIHHTTLERKMEKYNIE